MNKVIFVIISILFTLNLSACEEEKASSTTEEEFIIVGYDAESNTHQINISNGTDRLLGRFTIYVDNPIEDGIVLKGVNFKLTGSSEDESKELAFYDAIDGIYFIINGQNRVYPLHESATTTSVLPLCSISAENPINIEIWAKTVHSEFTELNGFITVDDIAFGNTTEIGYDTIKTEKAWNPQLGNGSETAILELIDGLWGANWQRNHITISNDEITEEECTDIEVKLNNGQCVYNQCEGLSCGHGECAMNLESGAAQCDCYEGFGTWDNGLISCDQRLGRFDIERTNQDLPVNNNTNGVIIGEWNITINEAEDAKLTSIFFEMHGAKHSFSNFRLGIMHPELGYVQFGEITNENQYSELVEDQDDMSIIISIPIDSEELYSLKKGSVTMIRLIADIHGTAGESITSKIQYASIISTEVFGLEYGKSLYADFQLGSSSLESAVMGSGYLEQWHPTATIQ